MYKPEKENWTETFCVAVSVLGSLLSILIAGSIITGAVWFTKVFCYPH